MSPIDEIEEEEKEREDAEDEEFKVSNRGGRKRRLVKKLGEEFDRVAFENVGSDGSGRMGSKSDLSKGSGDGSESDSVAVRTRSGRRLMKGGEAVRLVVEDMKKSKESDSGKNPISVSANRVRTSPRLAKRVTN